MIIFLYGPDEYRRAEKKKAIIEEFRKKHSNLGVGVFDLALEEDVPKFHDFIRNQSIFEPAKLVVLENSFESQNGTLASEFKKALAAPATTILISEREKPPKSLAFLLKTPVISQIFDTLKGKQWETFVRSEVKRRGIPLTEIALQFLQAAYEGDTWRLVTELEKIYWLERPRIEKEDLENLGLAITPNFWGLLSGLRGASFAVRLGTLEQIFGSNEPPAKVFNVLASLWREKVHAMARYDVAVKSGKLDYEEALLELVLS